MRRMYANKSTLKRLDDVGILLKEAHVAREHDAWFREQVKIGLKQANDPDAVWLSHEDVGIRMDAKIERLLAFNSK